MTHDKQPGVNTGHQLVTHGRQPGVNTGHQLVTHGSATSDSRSSWESARFSQPIIGTAEPIDDRLHNRFMGRHFENFRTWTVGQGIDINHHSIRDINTNLPNADVVLHHQHCDICVIDLS